MVLKADLSSKLAQVIEQIPRNVLYGFLCSYAQSHEELAMALVSEFWQAEKDDYHSMVQQCLKRPVSSAGRIWRKWCGSWIRWVNEMKLSQRWKPIKTRVTN